MTQPRNHRHQNHAVTGRTNHGEWLFQCGSGSCLERTLSFPYFLASRNAVRYGFLSLLSIPIVGRLVAWPLQRVTLAHGQRSLGRHAIVLVSS
jgi:hypothetical protein